MIVIILEDLVMDKNKEQNSHNSKWRKFKKKVFTPISPAMKISLFSCVALAVIFSVVGFVLIFRHYAFLPSFMLFLIIIGLGLLLSATMTLLFAALRQVRWQTVFILFLVIALAATTMTLALYLIPLLLFLMLSLYFGYMLIKGQYTGIGKIKKALRYAMFAISSVFTVVFAILIFWPGPVADRPEIATLALPYADRMNSTNASQLTNPSLSGIYIHDVLFYATPEQRLNPFPGEDVLATPTIDVSEILAGWSGIRRNQLGFDASELPLNAQVWMPQGEGPFPLTLIVHGNHPSGNRSNEGYAYLAEHLASRGIIAVSVDQNFLNISMLYDLMGINQLQNENGVRALVLLEHLRLWYGWNSNSTHQFYNIVDFDNIALIGHSRGGEAAALAAAFADLTHYPGNGSLIFDFPFSINTVVAIAPTHRQYNPAEVELTLTGVNYLVLHGGHDKDVSGFVGSNMYNRVDVSEYGIKASVWVSHANHGQFNTVWGDTDLPGLMALTTNRRQLMSDEEQQQVAKVFISAFLKATLLGQHDYTTLFNNFHYGEKWLPPAYYIIAFADNNSTLLDNFADGFDLSTSTSGLVSYSSTGFNSWRVENLPGRWNNTSRVLALSWGTGTHQNPPTFTMDFTQGTFNTGDTLYMSLSSNNQSINDPNISFQIRLTDNDERTSMMSINEFGGVVNPIETRIYTPILMRLTDMQEPVLQMVSIPTAEFNGIYGEIVRMEWIMDDLDIEQTLFVDALRISE